MGGQGIPVIATSIKYIDQSLTGLAADTALLGASDVRIAWIVVEFYDGTDGGTTIKIGTASSDAIKLKNILTPDEYELFRGDLIGNVYITGAQAGKTLRLRVGLVK